MENDRPPVAGLVGRETGQIRLFNRVQFLSTPIFPHKDQTRP
jgi:hypothetical protein